MWSGATPSCLMKRAGWNLSFLLPMTLLYGKKRSMIFRSQTKNWIISSTGPLMTCVAPLPAWLGVVNLGMLEAKESVARKYFDLLGKVAFEMNAMLSRLLTVHEIYQHSFKTEEFVVKEELKSYVEEFRNKKPHFFRLISSTTYRPG